MAHRNSLPRTLIEEAYMETINQYDRVLLKDGREGTAVEVLGDQEAFLVDVGSSPKDWDNIYVKRDGILKVTQPAK